MPASEKERVYAELDRTRRKCAALKREVALLKDRGTAKDAAALRREAVEYRKALSNILYRLDNGGVSDTDLRSIAESALVLRGLRRYQREEIEGLREVQS